MTRSKFKLTFLISILLLSNVFVLNMTSADTHVLPQIGEGDDSPLLDGNITSTEWTTSVSFTTELNGRETTIFVTSDSTNLYIGFNMSSTGFVSVNDTLPADAGYTLSYNNATHDWFALVIDNNLDKEISGSSVATETSADDVVVFDQYFQGSYDAYADGNSTMNFFPDSTITYSGGAEDTVLPGNGGTDDVNSDRNITSTQVVYEFSKPLNGDDASGYDFMLSNLGILQFKLLSFTSSQANDTLNTANSDASDWFSLRVNDDGNALTTKAVANTSVSLIGHSIDADQIDAFQTLAELYGFELNIQSTDDNVTYSAHDLNIFMVGDGATISNAQADRLRSYVRSGGNVMIMLGESGSSRNVAELFELKYLTNSVMEGVNDTELSLTSYNDDVDFVSQNVLTNRTVSSVNITSGALNTTDVFDSSNKFILGQEYMAYNLFDHPENIAYDSNGNGNITGEENFDNLSLGVAIDFLKGGRVSVLPTTSILTDGTIAQGDNSVYLLKLLPWNSRIVNTLEIHSTDVDKRTITEGQSITVTVNMTDGLGNTLDIGETVQVEVIIAGNVLAVVNLTQVGDTSEYEGDVTISENGFMELEITGFADAYGFAEGNTQDVFVEADVPHFNDLSELSPVLVLFFLISIAAFALVYITVRKY